MILGIVLILIFIFFLTKEIFFYPEKKMIFYNQEFLAPSWWQQDQNKIYTSSWFLILEKDLSFLQDWVLDEEIESWNYFQGKGSFLDERRHLFFMKKKRGYLVSVSRVFEAGIEDYYVEKIFKDLEF